MAVRTIACLPAVTGTGAARAAACQLSTSGTFGFDTAGLERPDLSPPRPHDQHDPARRRAEADGASVAAGEGARVYNSNPAAVAPDQQRRACAG